MALLAILVVAGASVLTAQAPAGRPLFGVPGSGTLAAKPASAVSTGLDDPRPLSLTLTHPTPIQTVLQLLFRGTGYTTVVPPSLAGAFSGELRNVTLRQALEAVLTPAGLDYHVRGTVVLVFPRDLAQEGRR